MLECLAVQKGQEVGDFADIVDRLAALPLPPAPVLLVSAHDDRLADALARGLNRPVVTIEAADLADLDFYERPGMSRVSSDAKSLEQSAYLGVTD
jgi:hypothetical protein